LARVRLSVAVDSGTFSGGRGPFPHTCLVPTPQAEPCFLPSFFPLSFPHTLFSIAKTGLKGGPAPIPFYRNISFYMGTCRSSVPPGLFGPFSWNLLLLYFLLDFIPLYNPPPPFAPLSLELFPLRDGNPSKDASLVSLAYSPPPPLSWPPSLEVCVPWFLTL